MQLANQGEPLHYVADVGYGGRSQTKIYHSGEYYRVNCPFCKDTRKRLWINHKYGQYDNYGHPMTFLATCYNDECLSVASNRSSLFNAIYGLQNGRKKLPPFPLADVPWDSAASATARLPGECIPLTRLAQVSPNHPAVQYMLGKRRYTHALLDKFNISLCTRPLPEFEYVADRIIFPVYMRDQLVGWQARYIDTANWKVTPKYYSMKGMKKQQFLYNFDNAKDSPFVVVVEGPTDCRPLYDCGVGLFGKSISRKQYDLLLQTWAGKPIIMLLDADALEESTSVIKDMQRNGVCVVQGQLPAGTDPGDYDRSAVMNLVYAQARNIGVILPN